MKHSPLLFLLASCSLLCTACAHAAPESASEPDPHVTDAPAATDPVDSVPPADSAAETAAGSETLPTEPDTDALIPVPEISVPDYQGGDGGEEHAETPLPQYFTYRFYESGVSVRLAGGNYQGLDLDLSGISPEDAEGGYYLFDSDFDGDLDLSVPTVYLDSHKEFAVFLWDDADAHFSEAPLLLSDPQYFPEEKHLTTLSQSGTEAVVQDCIWQDGSVFPVLTARLDIPGSTLEIVQSSPDGTAFSNSEQMPETAELTEKLLLYYNRKNVS